MVDPKICLFLKNESPELFNRTNNFCCKENSFSNAEVCKTVRTFLILINLMKIPDLGVRSCCLRVQEAIFSA